MSTADLLVKINGLPEDMRKQVLDLVDALLKRQSKPEPPRKHIPFGKFKGKVKMANDFDAPLDDLKSYMG